MRLSTRTSSTLLTPPEAMMRRPVPVMRPRASTLGPCSMPSPAMSVHTISRTPRRPLSLSSPTASGPEPSTHHRQASTLSRAPRMLPARLLHQGGVFRRGGAENNPLHAPPQHFVHGRHVPDAAAQLHGNVHRLHDGLHHVQVARQPLEGAVQVHHVQPPRARL